MIEIILCQFFIIIKQTKMFQYPLTKISKELWHKKVQMTSMFSLLAEDQALPILYQILDVLEHLNKFTLEQVLGEDVRQYFFNQVFPAVCSKIIKSRYFKNQIVLTVSNQILANSLYLYPKYLDSIDKYRGLNQIICTVLSSDEYYFKTNNQLDHKLYPHYYFQNLSNYEFTKTLKQNDLVDVIKSNGKYDKLVWSRGKVVNYNQSYLQVEYLNGVNESSITIDRHSFQVAPFKSKSKDFQWRMGLKVGDIVDCQQSFSTWHHGTVVKVINHENGAKSVKVTFKVYDQNGNKIDEHGKFYGYTDFQQTFDVTVPRIMPFCSTCKYRNYEITKSSFQTDDSNDMVFQQIQGQKIYALPRKRYLSEFYFKELNTFGRMGGFDKAINKMKNQLNFQFLCNFVKAIGNVCPYIHKQVIIQLVENIKTAVEKHLFTQSDVVTKQFTKERSQALFSGLKSIIKRLYSTEQVTQYQNSLKMKLVSQCLQSQSLKRKLQGLHELKDIVRGISHISERTKTAKAWIIQEKIFDKIYLQNSHVQLIKKSEDFFKFLINEDILEVKDLQRLYKIAQKGDFESRVSLYKLFQQMSHVFNRSHVDFLIDTILESDLNLILNQDIDMLHELSRFSNYFPKQKVKAFFQKLILNDSKNKEMVQYAIKKYSQIVARGYQMKNHRRQIIKNFIAKINTNDYQKVIKVLKGIFDGINVGEWGRKDLLDILQEENIESVIVNAISQSKQKHDYKKIVQQMLNFQLFLVKLNSKIKIRLETLTKIWDILKQDPTRKNDYQKWLNQIMQTDQGIEVSAQKDSSDLVQFYKQLFSPLSLRNLTGEQFTLAKSLFVQINRKQNLLIVSNVIKQKQIQKEYKRRVPMNSLKLLTEIQTIIFECKNKQISEKAFHFYLELYSSKENSKSEIFEFLSTMLDKLKIVYINNEFLKIERTLNIIEMIINDSEKYQELGIVSMIKCRKSHFLNITVINDVSYASDSIKKQNFFEKKTLSLFQLKLKIASKLNVNLDQLKLVGKFQLTDYYNSYTLGQLGISSEDLLTASRKPIASIPEQDLIIDDQLTPKALRIFKIIYEKYATHNGQMSKQDYNKFTAMCLGTYTRNYIDKIHLIYIKYDSNQDGLLSFQDFIKFYTEAALEKSQTVWNNLKNLGVKGNLKFKDEPEDLLSQQNLPRSILYNNEDFYDILFNLLQQKSISKMVFNLLLRLPANKTMHSQIRNIWKDDYNYDGKDDLRIFLTEDSKFRFMYKLILILNIIDFIDSSNSKWSVQFALKRGYQIPFQFFKQIAESKDAYSTLELDIIQLLFQIFKQYVYNAFSSQQSVQSSSLFQEDCTIDEKISCLLTGVYPKQFSSLRRNYMNGFRYEWTTSKAQFIKMFINMLKKMKKQCSVAQPQKKSVISSMIFKLMTLLCSLLINQNQEDLLPLYSDFFGEKDSPKELNQFYIMILCICFYSKPSQQHLHIHQLFKYIKSKFITSEHFRVLAMLVSKFGFKEQNLNQIPEVLLQNILEEENQPTIQGCAKLLCNFQVNQLSSITPKDVEKIFDKCLFGENITCKRQPARNQVYELLIKISQANKQIAQQVVQKTKHVILENMPLMKVTYSSEVNKRSSYGYAGLKNLGNICYMNSMIQQLYVNKTFRYLLLRVNDQKQPEWILDSKKEKVDDNFLHQTQRIFAFLQKTTRQQFSPNAFCIAYKPFGESVNIMMQQDVQEFVSMFFDRLQQGIRQHPLRNLVQNFYTGKTANLFKCHNCKKAKKIEENFHSISLEVKNSKNLSQSFNRYALGEVINDYKCDFCQQKIDVSKMTRISKLPQVLIIHLQRIVFNLDTFINDKITSKHQFPMQLNVYPYTLEHFDKEQSSQQHPQDLSQFDYQLTGIIIHIGNAESGHYISFIKTEDNRWLQFNDSLISLFSVNSIQAECFGGVMSSFEDDFEWEKKQSSKSAYLLIYNRKLNPTLQIILKESQVAKKSQILSSLKLDQQKESLNRQILETSTQKISQPTQSQEQTTSAFQDSQKQHQKIKIREEEDQKQFEMIKKKKSEDNFHNKFDQVVEKQIKKDGFTVKIKNQITPFIDKNLLQEIEIDNRVHFFQTSLASEGFSTFFAKLISIPHLHSEELIRMCLKLTFNFWLKSKSFKQLLNALQTYLKTHPESVCELVLNNEQFFSLLIQNSNMDIRVNIANFLANAIESYGLTGQKNGQFLSSESSVGIKIFEFLDKLFNLIPTTVTKCWTKFNQYFEFWYFISQKKIFFQYLVQKQVLKHFVDYFLDKKSPLKIYTSIKVQQIGSSYASPDFSMLLRCVSSLLNSYFDQKYLFQLNQEEKKVVICFEFIQKLISEGYQEIAAKMAKKICPQNIKASQKFAVVLLKGFSKSSYENIQKYINVLKQYIVIEDEHQLTRMQWVLGKQTLNVNPITKSLNALQAKNFEERLYFFQPSLSIQQGASFLQPLYSLNKRVQNFCLLCLQGLIQICMKSKIVRSYIFHLGSPTLSFGGYLQSKEQFINRYIDQSLKSFYQIITPFNKTQLGKQIKQQYIKLMQMKRQEYHPSECLTSQQIVNNQSKQSQTSDKPLPVQKNFIDQQQSKLLLRSQQQTVENMDKIQFLNDSFSKESKIQLNSLTQLPLNLSCSDQKPQSQSLESYYKKQSHESENYYKKQSESSENYYKQQSQSSEIYQKNQSQECDHYNQPQGFLRTHSQQVPQLLNLPSKQKSEYSLENQTYHILTQKQSITENKKQLQWYEIDNSFEGNELELKPGNLGTKSQSQSTSQQIHQTQQLIQPYLKKIPSNQDEDKNQPTIKQEKIQQEQKQNEEQIWETDLLNSIQTVYEVNDNDSNKNNSRHSQVQGNDSRDDDFNGIEMKQIQQTAGPIHSKEDSQPSNQDQSASPNQVPKLGIVTPLNQADGKSCEWSDSSKQDNGSKTKPANPKNIPKQTIDDLAWLVQNENYSKPENSSIKNSIKEGLKIQSKKRSPHDQQLSEVQNSDIDENQQFMKTKKDAEAQNNKEKQFQNEYQSVRHPVQFIYTPIQSLQPCKELSGIEVTYHQSKLISIKTKPTGTTNLAFTKIQGSRKLSNRIKKQCWATKRQEIVKGFFISNSSRMHVRVQTPTACYLIKPCQSGWIWSVNILKIWKCETCFSSDWPSWSLFE